MYVWYDIYMYGIQEESQERKLFIESQSIKILSKI